MKLFNTNQKDLILHYSNNTITYVTHNDIRYKVLWEYDGILWVK